MQRAKESYDPPTEDTHSNFSSAYIQIPDIDFGWSQLWIGLVGNQTNVHISEYKRTNTGWLNLQCRLFLEIDYRQWVVPSDHQSGYLWSMESVCKNKERVHSSQQIIWIHIILYLQVNIKRQQSTSTTELI
eukprot:TRINITY_DN10190_c0_g1_i1.p1 TRINITY_DN10190_c0_g1~~TRINITY_DN10190_c0_g1_i1.p1  ORF type:complete len:131 (-),score=9.56 TRINITY_DN10190_c0_g1_i1:416-808(-)